MAEVIEFFAKKPAAPENYSIDVTQYPDELLFTVNDIRVNPESLQKIADALEKIARIIRADVITRAI